MDPASPCGLRRGKAQRCRGSPCRAVARRAKAGPSGLRTDARHRPVVCPAPGLAGRLLRPCAVGACGTTGRKAAPAAPAVVDAGIPYAAFTAHGWWSSPAPTSVRAEPGLGRRSSPAFRTRMDFSACCITDRELSLAPTPPEPRELSHGHALGPSARRVGVNLLSNCGRALPRIGRRKC
jgi:hypothetical protein